MQNDEQVQTLESGDLYVFVRPRVRAADEEEQAPHGLTDIQNLYLIFSPDDRDVYRLALIGRERMPKPESSGRQRYWGFIEAVEHGPRKLMDNLQEETYETKTRGERVRPAARPAGEGVYRILRHEDHTHLVYALELPKEPGEVQEELRIEEEASYVIAIKNPEASTPPQAGLPSGAKPDYSKELEEGFRDRRFGEADPTEYLDYEGTQFLLVSASGDVKDELGIDLEPQEEKESTAEIFKDLRLRKQEHPLEPLFKGEWA